MNVKVLKMKDIRQTLKTVRYKNPGQIYIPDWYSLEETGITQSKIQDWIQCKRLFAMKMAGYSDPLKESKVGFGNCVHQILDWIYGVRKMPDKRGIDELVIRYEKEFMQNSTLPKQEQHFQLAKAQGTLWGYVEYYHDEFDKREYYDPEHTFEVRFNGFKLRGKIDISYRDMNNKKWIEDHKTKSRIEESNILSYLPLDIQCLFYILCDELETGERAKGMVYNVVRNAGSKLWANETVEKYKYRIYEETVKRPDHYFKRWEAIYTKNDMDEFKADLMEWLDEIAYFIKTHRKPRPSRKCLSPFRCEFLDQCSGQHLNELSTNNPPFPELELQNANNSKKNTTKKPNISKKSIERLKAKIRTELTE